MPKQPADPAAISPPDKKKLKSVRTAPNIQQNSDDIDTPNILHSGSGKGRGSGEARGPGLGSQVEGAQAQAGAGADQPVTLLNQQQMRLASSGNVDCLLTSCKGHWLHDDWSPCHEYCIMLARPLLFCNQDIYHASDSLQCTGNVAASYIAIYAFTCLSKHICKGVSYSCC